MPPTLFVLCAAAAVQTEPAAPREPGAPELPPVLTLGKALEIFRARGFDLIVADANVRWASGDLSLARGLPNPSLFLSAGKTFKCAPSQDPPITSHPDSP